MQQLSSISRRRLLGGLAALTASAFTAACGGATTAPTTAPKAAEPTKPAAVVTSAPAAGATTAPAAGATTAPATGATAAPTAAAATAAPKVAATTAPAAQPAASLSTAKIVFWGHDNHPVANAIPGFKERQPNVTVDAQALGDWLVKFRASLASGKDVPDLVWLEATTIQELGPQGVLLDVSDVVKPIQDKFIKAKANEAFIAKKQAYVGVPGDAGLVGLWYRSDILEKAGVKDLPKDLKFNDFVRMATDINKSTGAAAFLLPKNGWAWPFQIILSQLGGSVTTMDGEKVTIDDEKGIAAMNSVKQLWETKANLDTEWLKAPYYAALKGGKLATDFMPAWMRGFVRAEAKTPDEGLGMWKVAPLPALDGGISRTAQIGGATLASTKFTQSPEAVKEYMKYAFATVDGATATGSWGIIPSYLPYLEGAIFQNQKDPIFGDFLFSKVWADLAKELAPNFARTAVYNEAGQSITRNMMPILTGEMPVEAGMKKIGEEVRQANARYQG